MVVHGAVEPLISEDFEPRASAVPVDKPVSKASVATTAKKTVTAENTSSGTAPDQRFLCQHRVCPICVCLNPISVSTIPGNTSRTCVSAWVRLRPTIN